MGDTGAAPFERGSTHYGLSGAIDTSAYGTSVGLEGRAHVFPDTNPSDRKVRRSQNDVRAIAVRNVSGFTIYAGFLMLWSIRGKRVAGRVNTINAEIAGVVDDHVGSGGVRNGDIFWLIVEGPCLARLSLTANDECTYSAGAYLVSVTAATSNATTAGRFTDAVNTFTETQTTDGTLFNRLVNRFARAISAATTADTGALRLVDMKLQ